jgi:hypothetical protein
VFRRRVFITSTERDQIIGLVTDACRDRPEPDIDIPAALADIRYRHVRLPRRRVRRLALPMQWSWRINPRNSAIAVTVALAVVFVWIAAALATPTAGPASTGNSPEVRVYRHGPPVLARDHSESLDNRKRPAVDSLSELDMDASPAVHPASGAVSVGHEHFADGWELNVGLSADEMLAGFSFSYKIPYEGIMTEFNAIVGPSTNAKASTGCIWTVDTDKKTNLSTMAVPPNHKGHLRVPLGTANSLTIHIKPTNPDAPHLACAMGNPHIVTTASPHPSPSKARSDHINGGPTTAITPTAITPTAITPTATPANPPPASATTQSTPSTPPPADNSPSTGAHE